MSGRAEAIGGGGPACEGCTTAGRSGCAASKCSSTGHGCAGGGRAVFAYNGSIVLATGAEQRPLLPLTAAPLAAGDAAGKFDAQQTDNVLAAVAAAWALGLSDDLMRAGIATYNPGQPG